jgi:hypothetical protein
MIPLCTFLCMMSYGVFVFVCKSYYFECLIKELGLNRNASSNTTYKPTSFDKDEILANHRSFMTPLNIPSGKEFEDQKIFRVFQNPHVIYATTRVNSSIIFLLSLFYCRENLCQVNRQFFRRTSWWSVSVDKASNNIVFVCKSYYFECLIKELGINSNTSSNTTYKSKQFHNISVVPLLLQTESLSGE